MTQQHVIGEFICDKVEVMRMRDCSKACLTIDELIAYKTNKLPYAWHISDLKIYDKPKELSEFVTAREKDYCDGCDVAWESCNGDYHCTQKHCDGYHLSRPPQSWCYVQE